jgi:hypothetical protein
MDRIDLHVFVTDPRAKHGQQSFDIPKIKSQIESQFPKNTNGEFENIEAVLSRLEELAAQYNDPRIAEMMYFDEQAGMFKWNI